MLPKNLLLAAALALTLTNPVFAEEANAASSRPPETRNSPNGRRIGFSAKAGSDYIQINFSNSSPVNVQDFQKDPGVIVTPEVKGGFKVSAGHRVMTISGDFTPDTIYSVRIPKGKLVFDDGLKTQSDVFFQVRIPEGSPSLSIATSGRYFPIHAKNYSIPVTACNIREMDVSLWRLYDVNLDFQTSSYPGSIREYGEPLTKKKIAVPPGPGKKTFSLDLEELAGKREPGVYGLVIRDSALTDRDWYTWDREDSCSLIVTDLAGVTVFDPAERTMDVFVHSIATGRPVDGAQVRVFSRKNQTVAEGVTKEGLARLRFSGSYAPEHDPVDRCVVRYGNDATILPPLDGASSLNGNTGRTEKKGCCAFVYTERDMVRPGETFHASAFLRQKKADGKWEPVTGAPVRLMLKDPSGKIVAEKNTVSGQEGFVSETFALPENAPTGQYRILCGLSPDLVFGECAVIAAVYMPDRIRVGLTASKEEARPGETIDFSTRAEYYFGGQLPASAAWNFSVRAGQYRRPDFWRGWTVGKKSDPAFSLKSFSRSNSEKLPEKISWDIPEEDEWDLPVQFTASLSVTEPGGRAVTGYARVLVDPFKSYIGVRRVPGPDAVEFALLPGKEGTAVDAEEAEISMCGVTWEYVRMKQNGVYRLDWERREIPVAGVLPEKVRLSAEPVRFPLTNLESGAYKIEVRAGNRKTVFSFFHSYGETGARSMDPRILTLQADKEKYAPGDIAKLELNVPANSFAMIVHGEAGAEQAVRKDFAEGGRQTVEIPIRADVNSEAWHGTITLVSHAKTGDLQRTFAFFTLKIDQERNRLIPELNIPKVLRPGETLKGEVRLADPSGKPMGGLVHIFAVDEGILALSDFRTPDVFHAFFGPLHWHVWVNDIYERLYPDLKFLPDGTIGGGESMALSKRLEHIRQKAPAVVVPPPVSVPGSGVAQWSFDLPDHTGALRVMAVAVSGQAAGSAEKELILRDEATAMISLPQTVSPGDEFDVTVTINNLELPENAEITLDLEVPPFLTIKDRAEWKGVVHRNAPVTRSFRCVAGDMPGSGDIRVRLRGGSLDRVRKEPVTVRTGGALERRSEVRLLEPGASMEVSFPVKDWRRAEHTIAVMGQPASGAAFALDYLTKYPYGCTEQRTSCAFPYLAITDLIRAGVLDPRAERSALDRLEEASSELLSVLRNNGSFPMWQNDTVVWDEASVYASLFFFEAQARGMLRTDPALLRKMRSYLTSLLQEGRLKNKRMLRACACYALAVASDDAFVKSARNLISVDEPDFASLIAALSMIRGGYAAEGADYLNGLMNAGVWLSPESMFPFGGDRPGFGMLLTLLMENAPDNKYIPNVAGRLLAQLKNGKRAWGSTQENAWAARGLAAFAARYPAKPYRIRLTGAGENRILGDRETIHPKPGETVRLVNEGEGAALFRVESEGIPTVPRTADGPIRVTKTYLASDGLPVWEVRHGDLLTVAISLNCPRGLQNAVLCCILPAGLEIEDGSLATRKKTPTWFSKWIGPRNVEKRADRFLLFFHAREGMSEIHFTVRAVTRGVFSDPPCTVEEMYDPDMFGSLSGSAPIHIK